MADPRVGQALAWLKKHSRNPCATAWRATPFPNDHALGVRMGDIQKLGKHWAGITRWRSSSGRPASTRRACCARSSTSRSKVTPAQMDAQARDFDNWAICDTLCFALWVRSPHALDEDPQVGARSREEYVKRAAFALLASVALHDKDASDDAIPARCLPLIEKAATDERNFVKKGVNWALRGVGDRSPRSTSPRWRSRKNSPHRRRRAALDRQGRAASARDAGRSRSASPDRDEGMARCCREFKTARRPYGTTLAA